MWFKVCLVGFELHEGLSILKLDCWAADDNAGSGAQDLWGEWVVETAVWVFGCVLICEWDLGLESVSESKIIIYLD